MSPELATRTTEPDTQPLPRRDPGSTLDALVAELAVAEKWPTPADDWCARCGFAPCIATMPNVIPEDDGTCTYDLAGPQALDTWAMLAAGDALHAVGIRHDTPGRRELARALSSALGREAR